MKRFIVAHPLAATDIAMGLLGAIGLVLIRLGGWLSDGGNHLADLGTED